MSTPAAFPSTAPLNTGNRQQRPGMAVVGWLMLSFAIMPITMAAHGDGTIYSWTGLLMVAVGAGLVVATRRAQRG